MKSYKTTLLLFSLGCFGMLQAQEDCGAISITSIEETHWDVDDTGNGEIKLILNDEDPSEGVITFEYSGDNGVSQSEFTMSPLEEDVPAGTRTYQIEALSAGTYTVTVRKYCIPNWGDPADVTSQDESTVTVRGVPSLSALADEERPALATCVHAGIAKISIAKGTAPYSLEITSGPENNSLVGTSHTFNETPFYLYNLQNGIYNGNITDSNGFEVNINFTVSTYEFYSYSVINYTYYLSSPILIKPYLNHADGPYNVFRVVREHLHAPDNYASSYTSSPDSLSKYFNLRWYFTDDSNTTYPVEYKKLNDTDSAAYYYLTLPEGMDFKDVTDGSKMMQLYQMGYRDEVISGEACNNNPNVHYRNIITGSASLKQYEPIAEVGSEAFRFEVYSNVGANGCTAGLRFPINQSSEIELIIFPIKYTVNKKAEDETLTSIYSGEYNGNTSEYCRIPHVELGTYVIKYGDALGNEWEQEIEVTENDISQPMDNIEARVVPQYRDFAFKDFREEYADDYNDMGTYICLIYEFTKGGTLSQMTFTYEEVPNDFYLPAGTTEPIDSGITNFYPTQRNVGGYWQFVPGKYRLSFTPQDSCGIPYVHDVIIDEPDIENFSYEITTDCDNLNIELSSDIRFLHPDRGRGSNGNKYYYPASGLYYCIAIERTDVDGLTRKEFFDTSKKQFSTVKNTTIPLDQILHMDGKEVTDCKLSVYFYIGANAGNMSNIGDFSGASGTRQFFYAREVDMDFEKIKAGDYATFRIDPTKTSGYMCGMDAHISAMASGGSEAYTYSLYETNSFDQLPSDTEIPIDTQTGGKDETVIFSITPGILSQRYWVKAEDNSDCYEPKYHGVVIYTLDTGMSISKTEDLCDGDELNLEIYYLDGAMYTWYQGGTVQGGDVVGGTVRRNGVGLNTYTVTRAEDSHLGTYHVKVIEETTCGIGYIYSVDVTFVPQVMFWDPQGNSSDWDNENNWYPNNQGIPFECTDVYIPGNATPFPSLVEGGRNLCRDIYFMPGAQLGQPQLLEYRYAYTQLDYGTGVLGSTQTTNMTKERLVEIGRDHITSADRIAYGAATSGVKLDRDRWNMLSAPLGYITTGDFAFGGFPFSYIKKFDPAGNEETYIFGKWADYSNEGTLIFQAGQGFGHLYYDYDERPYYSMDHISQWADVKAEHNLPAPTPQSASGSSTDFGLAQTNGIVQFPYFADENLSDAHRNHVFTPSGTVAGNITDGISMFHLYYQKPITALEFLQLTGDATSSLRSEKAYRFIPEQHTFQRNNLDFTYNMGTFLTGDVVLIGNPYMSALDFEIFASANPRIKETGYQIFNGMDGYHEVVDAGSGIPMVPPMQSILVEIKTSGALNATFMAKDMAKTDSNAKLRSATNTVATDNLLIKAINPAGEVTAQIRRNDEAEDSFCSFDLSKIIASPATSERPEIYTLAATEENKQRALVVNTVQSNNVLIPLGIVTTYAGEIKLEFSGMDLYDADIIFIDVEAENSEMNITGKKTFSYTFSYIPQLDADGNAIAKENRFMIRIAPKNSMGTDQAEIKNELIAYIHNDELIVISSSDNIIEDIYGYDTQGRMIFSRHTIGKTFFKEKNLLGDSGVYIIKVHTRHGIKEIKVVK